MSAYRAIIERSAEGKSTLLFYRDGWRFFRFAGLCTIHRFAFDVFSCSELNGRRVIGHPSVAHLELEGSIEIETSGDP